MSENSDVSGGNWVDPDDAAEWSADQWDRAEIRVGERVVRPGRPPIGTATKQQVTLRLDPDVLARFRADGPGWQGRINDALRKAVGLDG